jgi:8-amino-7-oxononanoate synthase
MGHLEEHLAGTPKESEKIIITESVFSMEGDICKIDEIIHLAKKYKAMVIVDDAHGFGVIGHNGLGISDYCKDSQDIDCIIIPLGKACGSMGAIVLANQTICDALIQFARSYVYTTALPPAIPHATIESVRVMQEEKWRFKKLQQLIGYFIKRSKESGIQLISEELTPIKSILMPDENRLIQLQKRLLGKGLYVSAIRPPSVPKNTSRIRVSLNCLHSEEQIDYLIQSILEA